MKRPARILFVVNDAPFFLSHRLPIATAASAEGYDVHVATPEDSSTAEIREAGFSFHPIGMSRKGTFAWAELKTCMGLLRLYRRLRPDLVHHVTVKPVVYGGVAARLARVPAVVSAFTGLGYLFITRGLRAAILRRTVKTLCQVALAQRNGRVIFQNPEDRDLFLRAGLVSEKGAVLIKGSGVDMAHFTPKPEPAGKVLIIFASRMLWDKGVGEFVEAARRFGSENRNTRFALVGTPDTGNPTSVSEAQIEAWKKEGAVECWGQRNDMPDVFAQAHIVCLPSYGEGVPKVLVEAAACARPIVASDVPGCREIVRNGENGLLVPSKNVDALVAALERLILDPALRARMGWCGRRIAETEFSLKQVIEETLAVYRELLAA